MNITREDQIKFAEAILLLIEASTTPEELEPLSATATLVLRWTGTKDNGVIFDLCEYIYEDSHISSSRATRQEYAHNHIMAFL